MVIYADSETDEFTQTLITGLHWKAVVVELTLGSQAASAGTETVIGTAAVGLTGPILQIATEPPLQVAGKTVGAVVLR